MILMSELVLDKAYRAFLDREPDVPDYPKLEGFTPPWTVYVQRRAQGKWAKRDFWKYRKALKFFDKAVRLGVNDVALNNKRIYTPPPSRLVRVRGKFVRGSDGLERQATKRVVWAPSMKLLIEQPEHLWCGYCRRPTVFKFYSKHPRLSVVDSTVRRCCICGASSRIATPRANPNKGTR